MATSKEPVPGWIDNFYGPIAVIYGAALGVLRVVPLNRQAISNIVPVDGCANLVLACAWRTAMEATQRKQQVISAPVTIYNYVPSSENIIYYSDFTGAVEEKRDVFPMAQAIWYPFLHTTRMPWLFKLVTIFYHLLPGYLVDLLLRLRGQKPRLIPIYKKIHKSLDVLQKFMIESWSFETPNTDRLWQSMSAADQQLFDFDMKSLDWQGYFDRALFGMRTYLGKEDPSEESIRLGLQKANRYVDNYIFQFADISYLVSQLFSTFSFLIMHRLLLFGLFCLGIAILRWLLCLFL